MIKLFAYSLKDLVRSLWTIIYFLFFFLVTLVLFLISSDSTKVLISLMNVVLILCPLIATMFGVMYYYNSREFIELLLAQPLKRFHIFWGQYLGVAFSLSLSIILGIGIPLLIFGFANYSSLSQYGILILNGVMLSFIFSGLGYLVALKFNNKIKGFGVAILLWLVLAIIYDGVVLLLMLLFKDYPLDQFSIIIGLLNPIDLARILLLLKLDISAIMGYTGAVIQKFLGSAMGMALVFLSLLLWFVIPFVGIRRVSNKKDF